MIPVAPAAEPADFDVRVRRPGRAFLEKNPHPKSGEFAKYWKQAAADVYAAYLRICSYSCMYIVTPPGTVDHFVPKSVKPALAYEWSNLRLSSYRLNTYKGDSADILDPFQIELGWFVLDFPSCLVRPGVEVPDDVKAKVEATIQKLKLNDDDALVQERCDMMVMFAKSEIALPFLQKRYPFLASEIVRQGIQQKANEIFKEPALKN